MKRTYNKLIILAAATAVCSCGFLDEDPSHIGTVESTYTTAEGLELALNGCYASLRTVHSDHTLWLAGTDLFGENGIPSADTYVSTSFNVYSNQTHTSDNATFYNFWTACYEAINRTNIVINKCSDIEMDTDLRNTRIAEAYVLRALYYSYLVEQFGDVPFLLKDTEEIATTATREPEENIYGHLITDIENNIGYLPWTPDATGRVSKGYAYTLLSMLYLTRGYKDYAQPDDFEKAASYARLVIDDGPYTLLDNYADIFEPGNEENSEIIFAVQYSDNLTTNDDGNNKHTLFCSYDAWPGMDRSTRYNRRLSKFAESLFLIYLYGVDPYNGHPLTADIQNGLPDGTSLITLPGDADFKIDKRFDGTFLRTVLADLDATYSPQVGADPKNANVKKNIKKDDIAIFFPYPNEDWSFSQIDEVQYCVVNHNMYHRRTSGDWAGDARNIRPLLNKFWEPNQYADNLGVRDMFLTRLGEVYLIAAEAYYKNGEPDKAADMINVIRKRAYGADWKDSFKITPDEVDIDFILDERGRELAGEAHVWVDLKRTGKLIERVLKYNLQAGHKNTSFISEKHYLRPLPYAWTSRLTNYVPQNPGYGSVEQ